VSRPLRNLHCKLWSGHDWGPWQPSLWTNLVGLNLLGFSYRVRWCKKCGAQDTASPW
jgi:hypothetical protein